ncbi:MAG TPA: LamB/YcsF family protein, partial [Synergistaceae bacterium]|nr:LamB/YcsF family protein [Synergistaceae bacterium]
ADLSVPFAAEAFADRAYTEKGTLVSRREPGAVLHDPEIISQRILEMITRGTVETITGKRISLKPSSICVHGDTPEAVEIAGTLRKNLEAQGIALKPLKEVLGL